MTKDQRIALFQVLKQEIEKQFRKTFPDCPSPIKDWKGKEIRDFQKDLGAKVGGYISEKWFYTHIKKSENKKLPREDMLTMLSKYVGYEDWETFLIKHQTPKSTVDKVSILDKTIITNNRSWRKISLVSGLVGIAILLIFTAQQSISTKSVKGHQFCFVDADSKEPIRSDKINIIILKNGESPLSVHTDSLGCYVFDNSYEGKIQFKVQAPYYKEQTITRVLNAPTEIIPLKADDYALMIHYFSTTKLKDWKKRRQQLDMMISDEAKIIQVSSETRRGMEMYNKSEFIDKMTMPLESLKNVEIIETTYDDDQITYIRFMQK